MQNLKTIDGVWWSPERPSKQSMGRLAPGDGGAILSLTDSYTPETFPRPSLNSHPLIHGTTVDGTSATLLNCYDIAKTSTSRGVGTRKIHVNHVLLGEHLQIGERSHYFDRIHLLWPDLLRWIRHTGVSMPDTGQGVFINYARPKQICLEIDPSVLIRIDTNIHPSFGIYGPITKEETVRELVWVTFELKELHTVSQCISLIEKLKAFVKVCTLSYSEPEQITLTDPQQSERPSSIELHSSSFLHASIDREPQYPDHALIPFSSIETRLSEYLSGWFKFAQTISPVPAFYHQVNYGNRFLLEPMFLALAQSIEVIHRRRYGGTYLDDEEFQVLLPRLLGQIPSQAPQHVKEALTGKLSYLNEYSLGKRLKDICRRHENLIARYVPNWKKVVRHIVDARNFYTHYSGEKDSAPGLDKLPSCIDFLLTLIEVELLNGSGIDLDLIHKSGSDCYYYAYRHDQRESSNSF